jgi:hypothetical protein
VRAHSIPIDELEYAGLFHPKDDLRFHSFAEPGKSHKNPFSYMRSQSNGHTCILGNKHEQSHRKERRSAKRLQPRAISDGNIDTTTASGELVFNIFSSLAQFERSLLQEGTLAGLKSARARGRLGGRPKLLKDSPKIKMAKKFHEDKSLSIDEICQTMKISKSTLYWYLKQ